MFLKALSWFLLITGATELAIGVSALPGPWDNIAGGFIGVCLGVGGILITAVNDA